MGKKIKGFVLAIKDVLAVDNKRSSWRGATKYVHSSKNKLLLLTREIPLT